MKSRYKPKKLKFSGEESFMVPKEGEKFILAVGADVVALDKQNAENIDVAPLEPTTVTNPSVVSNDTQVVTPPSVVIPVPDWQSMDCPTIQAEVNQLEEMLTYSRFTPDILSQYQSIIQSGKSVLNSKCGGGQVIPPDEVPPAPPVITEPSWSSLTCEQVVSEITALQGQLERGVAKIGKENYDNVTQYIANGKKYHEAHCVKGESPIDIKPYTTAGSGVGAPPITTITTTGTPIIATASTGGLGSAIGGVKGGGGSGGGGGAKEEPTKKANWLWLVAIVSGVYLLTRKN